MNPVSKNRLRFFKDCGRSGGRKRARLLSPLHRSAIAAQAAKARWKQKTPSSNLTESFRLNNPRWDDPVYLDEILSEGSLEDWKKIYQILDEYPFGPTALALEKVLACNPIYGATPLWKAILQSVQNT